MALNKVSAVLTQEAVDTTKADIKKIESEHPYLISLTSAERQALPKPGSRSLDFMEKCLALAKQNPNFLPRNFSLEEVEKDINLYRMLIQINQPLSALAQKFSDTITEVYAEGYISSLKIYNEAKQAGEELAGFEDVIDELAARFSRKFATKTATTPTK
jgi:hypothetical protein